jgi:carbon storage regulator CsrA
MSRRRRRPRLTYLATPRPRADMLVISRKPDEAFTISPDITVSVIRLDGGRVQVGIDAPREMRIDRIDAPWVTAVQEVAGE